MFYGFDDGQVCGNKDKTLSIQRNKENPSF